MIGLDTNVLIRYITQDDPEQSARATALIETRLSTQTPGFVTLITLVEIAWVLESCYHQPRSAILDILHGVLITKQLLVEKADVAYLALRQCSESSAADFSDALIASISAREGCAEVVTFDKKARAVGMVLL